MSISENYLCLSNNFIPKILERYYILHKINEDLYELSEDAFSFIISLKNGIPLNEVRKNKKFIDRLLKIGILEIRNKKRKRRLFLKKPPLPSLRYLEIQLTSRCNLRCKHCYQEKEDFELPLQNLLKILEDFKIAQGLRIILSGGEPLLYSHFKELNSYLKDYPAYVVLLTNGILLNKLNLSIIKNIDEIQFSLDGTKGGHDYLRGEGTFEKTISAIEKVKENTDKHISIATMVHKKNLSEFKALSKIVKKFKSKEWGIDYPVLTGAFKGHIELYPSISEAVETMKYKFGASYHSTEEENSYACGVHTMTLLPNGDFVPCGFYPHKVFGNINRGLFDALNNRQFFKLSSIKECKGCPHLSLCRGGCRFRAGGISKRDKFMCAIYGV